MHYLKFDNVAIINSKTVLLPPSKSESNRALIIKAISGDDFEIKNLSDAEDTIILYELLNIIKNRNDKDPLLTLNVGAAGTVMRFLTAFLCIKKGRWILTGNERMQQRPIKALVDGLNQIGAGISYAKKEGYPPITIKGDKINASSLNINSSISSQFASALLMIAPYLKDGLKINFNDRVVSRSYIEMTIRMMNHFGIICHFNEDSIYVNHQKYKGKDISINYDWSAASYFYEIIALSAQGTEMLLKDLKKEGLQGDEILSEIFNSFGVTTFVGDDGIKIKKDKPSVDNFIFDFTHCPDIAQTVIVCCAGMGIKGKFFGLESLAIKETDRMQALKNELAGFGCNINIIDKGTIELNERIKPVSEKHVVKTYNDHRMAMAFAPLALKIKNIIIENPEVVKKSYAKFWKNLAEIGFQFSGH